MFLLWLLTVGAASAQDEVFCEIDAGLPDDVMSVAWASPMRKKVGRNGKIEVVGTTQLRDWVKNEGRSGIGPMLVLLGAKKKSKEPKRVWKVTIFEARGGELCGTEVVAGLPVYEVRWRDVARRGFCLLPAERFVAEG